MRMKLSIRALMATIVIATGSVGAGLWAMPMAEPGTQAGADVASAGSSATTLSAASAKGAALGSDDPTFYILHLADEPLARYRGEIDELAATSPRATGEAKLNTGSPASQAYLSYLDSAQDATVAAIERALGHKVEVLHRYRYAFNGISVWLTPGEAARVATIDGVVRVERSKVELLTTDVGPRLIGAPKIWDGSATGGRPGTMGEGTVAGVIDTGINMDHPSFAATGPVDGYAHVNPRGAGKYLGWCDPANPNYDAKYVCNDKLIGAWSFPKASLNPEDEAGHGSHTSSTVAGNTVKLQAPTVTLDRTISGVAPHANLIMYDACAGNGCDSTATTAAIDQATADGVDVINYSIALGLDSPWLNSRQVAFLGAYEAGILVAASAGNAGNPGTTNATGPWVMSVAATTHGRSFSNSLVNMTGGTNPPADMEGAGFTGGYGPAKIVFAAGYNNVDGVPDDGKCLKPFPAGTWTGEIVVCDRGDVARVLKGQYVKAGGAGGYVLANTAAQGEATVGDMHYVPGINLGVSNAQTLKTWLATAGDHMAQIKGITVVEDTAAADNMANFSSRGPALTSICCRRPDLAVDRSYLDLLKPDIGGPGVDVMAALIADEFSTPPEFGSLSGTSMSSPHLAGSGALVRAVHPEWSPAEAKSALMLTADNVVTHKEDGTSPAAPFDIGSGRVDLTKAAQTGLVLDVTGADFEKADPDKGGKPSELNLPSLADAWCFGVCGWKRTLKSTRAAAVNWMATVAPWTGDAGLPAGLKLTVSPATFSIAAGGTQSLTVDADALDVPVDQWVFAQIVLKAEGGAAPDAHLPVAIRRADRRLPPAVVIYTDKTTGSHPVTGLRAPAITELAIDPYGLVKGAVGSATVAVDPTNTDPYNDPTGTLVLTRTVPADAKRLVTEITGSTADDIDLYVGRDTNGDGRPAQNEMVCTSGREKWDELCDITNPPPGVYWILMQNFDGSDSPPDRIDYVTGLVPGSSASNMRVTGPINVPALQPFDLAIDWTLPSIKAGDRWFGAMRLGTTPANRGDIGMIVVDLIGIGAVPPTPQPSPTVVEPTPTSIGPTPTRVRPTPTIRPTEPPVPTPTPGGMCVCRLIQAGGNGVPQSRIDAAVANPNAVSGWQKPLIPGRPVGPFNPLRTCLSIQNTARNYHPVYNGLVFKAGCP